MLFRSIFYRECNAEFGIGFAAGNGRYDRRKVLAVEIEGKFESVDTGISGKLALIVALAILDILVPRLNIEAGCFQCFFLISDTDRC